MRRSMSRSWTSEELRTGRSHRSSKSTMGQKIWTHLHKNADDTRICLKVLVQSFASSLANPIHILLLFFMLESKLTFDGRGIDPQRPKGTVKTSSEASYPFGFDLESREHGKKGESHGDSLWQLCKAIAALSSPDYLFRCIAGVSKRVCLGLNTGSTLVQSCWKNLSIYLHCWLSLHSYRHNSCCWWCFWVILLLQVYSWRWS